jgi:hypothetical protein
VTGREARVRGELRFKIATAQKALDAAAFEYATDPTTKLMELVSAAEQTLKNLKAYTEKNKIGDAASVADAEELDFARAVRRIVITEGKGEVFKFNEQCIRELRLIEELC